MIILNSTYFQLVELIMNDKHGNYSVRNLSQDTPLVRDECAKRLEVLIKELVVSGFVDNLSPAEVAHAVSAELFKDMANSLWDHRVDWEVIAYFYKNCDKFTQTRRAIEYFGVKDITNPDTTIALSKQSVELLKGALLIGQHSQTSVLNRTITTLAEVRLFECLLTLKFQEGKIIIPIKEEDGEGNPAVGINYLKTPVTTLVNLIYGVMNKGDDHG